MINMFNVNMPSTVDRYLSEVLHSGYIAQGPKVGEFELMLSIFTGSDKVVTLNSGTSALTLALYLAGVGPGDEVISTAMTCTATNLPIITAGAKIKFADIQLPNGNIDPESIEKLITRKTKAIMFVDWGGVPADARKIASIAKKHKLKVIQDSAHAFGAEYMGKHVGHYADFTCFSFQAIKHLTTGDGGMLICKRYKDYDRARLLRWFGIERENGGKDSRIDQDITEAGFKMHMNDISATIGIESLGQINKILARHRRIAEYYLEELSPYFILPSINTKKMHPSWWLFTVLLNDRDQRDKFIEYMHSKNIMVSRVHRRNDEYTVFKKFARDDLFNLNEFSDRMICLPIHANMSDADAEEVVARANGFFKQGEKRGQI